MGTEQEFGVAHIFGLKGDVTALTLQSDDISMKYALDVEIKDEEGRVITDRLDDFRYELSVEGILKTNDVVQPGDRLSYYSENFIIKEVTDRGTNMDYRKVSIRAVKYQEIA